MEIKSIKKPGIYKLVNKINNKIYIGKSINIYYRALAHKNDLRGNNLITRAIKKYGFNNFNIEVLHTIDNYDNNYLLALEVAFIDFYNTTNKNIGYNICLFATDKSGIPMSDQQKKKISKTVKQKYLNGQKNPFLNKKHTKQTKQKLSIIKKEAYKNGFINPRKGIKVSKESIRKRLKTITKNRSFQRENNPRYDKTIYTFKNLGTYEIINSTRFEFQSKNYISRLSIHRLIHGIKKKIKGWVIVNNTIPRILP